MHNITNKYRSTVHTINIFHVADYISARVFLPARNEHDTTRDAMRVAHM